jgi:hypothetical protein
MQEAFAGRFDPLGRRSGPGHGHDRHLQEPGQPTVRRDRYKMKAFLARSIEGDWPYQWIDATYVKVR